MTSGSDSLREIFDSICELDEADRAARLAEINDEDLRRDLEALLAADASSSELLSSDWMAELILPAAGQVGLRVGAFELTELLGAGGMGEVYLGRRVDGEFEQEAAIKLVRRDLTGAAAVAKFGAERQILARLNHPGIARLFDGGVTSDGRPYLVMELVDGVSIDEYCRQGELSLEERLRLFVRACEAAGYAHGNLIVHCDLKPDNILVTRAGEVKLLDFGIATALGGGEDRGSIAMTPDYAAPELFEGRPVTTAADVYSLGVILYELLTETVPLELEGLERESRRERIRTATIAPPSRRPRRAIGAAVPTDLDAICLCALARDPADRYPSPQALGADLVAFLAGRPVAARDRTFAYVAAKLVRRHAVLSAFVAVALAVVVGLTLFYTGRLAKERDRAREQASRAEAVKSALVGIFTAADPRIAKGEPMSAEALVKRGRAQVEGELGADPEARAELLAVLARVSFNLGLYADAQVMLESALELERAVSPTSQAVADNLELLADSLREQALFDRALAEAQAAIKLQRALHGDDSLEHAAALVVLSDIQVDVGDYAGGLATAERAIELRERLGADAGTLADTHQRIAGAEAERGDYADAEASYRRAHALGVAARGELDPRSANSIGDLGNALRKQARYDEAEPLYRQALAIREKLYEGDHADIAYNLNHLGRLFFQRGDLDAAEPFLRRALAMRRRLYGSSHAAVSASLGALSQLLMKRGDLEEPERLTRESLAILSSLYGESHPYVAGVVSSLASIAAARGDKAEAVALHRRALAIGRAVHEADNPRLAQVISGLAIALCESGKKREADKLFAEADAILAAKLDPDHPQRVAAREAAARCR